MAILAFVEIGYANGRARPSTGAWGSPSLIKVLLSIGSTKHQLTTN